LPAKKAAWLKANQTCLSNQSDYKNRGEIDGEVGVKLLKNGQSYMSPSGVPLC